MNDTTAFVFAVVCVVVGWFIYVPVNAYYVFKYYQNRHDGYIGHRRYQSAMVVAILNMSLVLIQRPLYLAGAFYPNSILDNEYWRLSLSNIAQLAGVLYVLRMWLLYYDYQRKKDLLAHKWKSQLQQELSKSVTHNKEMNDDNNAENMPWTMKHQTFFDNNTVLHSLAIIFAVLIIIITLISYYFSPFIFNVIQQSFLATFLLIAIVGYYKVHGCHDELDLRSEFLLSIFVCGIYIGTYGAVVTQYDTFSYERVLLSSMLLSTFCSASAWVLTGFIYVKLKNKNKNENKNENKCIIFSEKQEAIKKMESWIVQPLTFEEIIATNDGFELLANHLVMEYSIENMLFVLEIEIIKDEMIYYNQVNADSVSNRVPIHPKMRRIKRSDNLACNNYYHCVKNFQFLIVNYVRNDGPYCINLSSMTRNKILKSLSWMKDYLINNESDEFADIVRKKSFNSIRSMSIRSASSSMKLEKAASTSHYEMNSNDNMKLTIEVEKAIPTKLGMKSSSKDDKNWNKTNNKEEYMSLTEILKLFDIAVEQVCALMRTDSLSRFTKTKEYKKFYNVSADAIIKARINYNSSNFSGSPKQLTPKSPVLVSLKSISQSIASQADSIPQSGNDTDGR